MLRPFVLFVALRYVRSRRGNRFTTFVSLLSVAGIALGVAALIIVLSVMNGFEREVSRHVLGMSAHAMILPVRGLMQDWPDLREQALSEPGVVAAAPYLRGSGNVQSWAMFGWLP